jgi:hypothetical protein
MADLQKTFDGTKEKTMAQLTVWLHMWYELANHELDLEKASRYLKNAVGCISEITKKTGLVEEDIRMQRDRLMPSSSPRPPEPRRKRKKRRIRPVRMCKHCWHTAHPVLPSEPPTCIQCLNW